MEQKFKRGNLVKILVGHLIWVSTPEGGESRDISPKDIGRLGIIKSSYAEEHRPDSTNEQDYQKYSVVYQDTGSSIAWKNDNELEFIDIGGEHLLEEAKETWKMMETRESNLAWILPRLEEGNLGSISILHLFKLLGFKSSFLTNGEYFILQRDWTLFHKAFVGIKNANSLAEAMLIFHEKMRPHFKIQEVYNAFHNIKA